MELDCPWRGVFPPGLLIVGWLFGSIASADAQQLYRCAEGDHWVFQQTRCAPGTGTVFELSPENRVGSPLRASERRYLEERLKAGRERRSNIGSIGPAETRALPTSGKTCLGKLQALERVRRRLRQGYPPAEGERLRRRRDDLEQYLGRFCE
jgi:hypothetical protein